MLFFILFLIFIKFFFKQDIRLIYNSLLGFYDWNILKYIFMPLWIIWIDFFSMLNLCYFNMKSQCKISKFFSFKIVRPTKHLPIRYSLKLRIAFKTSTIHNLFWFYLFQIKLRTRPMPITVIAFPTQHLLYNQSVTFVYSRGAKSIWCIVSLSMLLSVTNNIWEWLQKGHDWSSRLWHSQRIKYA